MGFHLEFVANYIGINNIFRDKAVVYKIITDTGTKISEINIAIENLNTATPIDFHIDAIGDIDDFPLFVAELAIELHNYAAGNIRYCEVVRRNNSNYLACDYHDCETTMHVFDFINSVLNSLNIKPDQIKDRINLLWDLCLAKHPDWQADFLISYAQKVNLYYAPLNNRKWTYGTGARSITFFETSKVSELIKLRKQGLISTSKIGGKKIFHKFGVPTPAYKVVRSIEEALAEIKDLKFPIAVKPNSGARGRGVTAKVNSVNELIVSYENAVKTSKRQNPRILMEEHVSGAEYRLTIINHRLVGTVMRVPPSITGDGENSVIELINQLNSSRTRNKKKSNHLYSVKIDENLETVLDSQDCSLTYIPSLGEKIVLSSVGSTASGSMLAVNTVHSSIRDCAEQISRYIGVSALGIDFITTDISKSLNEVSCGFLEINTIPGLRPMIPFKHGSIGIGELFLSRYGNSAQVSCFIVKDESLAEFKQKKYDEKILILPNIFVHQGKSTKPTHLKSPESCVGRYMSLKHDQKILLLTDEYAIEAGIPIVPNMLIYVERDVDNEVLSILNNHEVPYQFL